LVAIVVGVKLCKFAPVSTGDRRRHSGLRRAISLFETAHACEHIARPANGLAIFAVIDDVDTDLRLFAHDIGDSIMQAGFECRFVVRLFVALHLEELLQLGRSDQAADVGCQDAMALGGTR
jgi:hypothetical protein